MGDEMDLKMFEHSQFKKNRNGANIFEDGAKNEYEVVKVHQF